MPLSGSQRKSARFNAVFRRSTRERGVSGLARSAARRIPPIVYFVLAALIIAVAGLAYAFLFSGQFTITDITIAGATAGVERDVRAYIHTALEERRFFVVQQNKTILFPADRLQEGLLDAFADIEAAAVTTELPHALIVDVRERTSEGIWCAYQNVPVGGVPSCFFYDHEGVVYEEAPNAARGFLITVVRDETVSSASRGDVVLDERTLSSVRELVAALDTFYERPRSITLKENGELRAGFSEGWEAYLSPSMSIAEQAEALGLVLEQDIGTRSGELEYVDVRLGNKVFYKFKQSESQELAQ
jgi:cell division septal protein FtsQ